MPKIGRILHAVVVLSALNSAVGAQEISQWQEVKSFPARDLVMMQKLATLKANSYRKRQAWLASGKAIPEDVTTPEITAGTILTPTINVAGAPTAPSISINLKTSSAGLSEANFFLYSATTSQVLQVIYTVPPGVQGLTSGKLVIQQPLPLYSKVGSFTPYSAPGTWTLMLAFLDDASGSSVSYQASQIATIFKTYSLTVTNPVAPDVTPPTIVSGKVLTPTVSLSSTHSAFTVALQVTDDISGADLTTVFVTYPDGSLTFGDEIAAPSPQVSGQVKGSDYFYSGSMTGTYTIEAVSVCDVAMNCTSVGGSAAVKSLFGKTTFKVTQ